jgi:predicted HTH domain antitoxin
MQRSSGMSSSVQVRGKDVCSGNSGMYNGTRCKQTKKHLCESVQATAEAVITFETAVPEDVYSTLRTQGLFREKLAEQAQRLLAVRFFQERLLSLGQTARLAGLDRWQFIDLLAENNVPVLAFNEEELADEFAAVAQLAEELASESA